MKVTTAVSRVSALLIWEGSHLPCCCILPLPPNMGSKRITCHHKACYLGMILALPEFTLSRISMIDVG
jgi:hypothetical protein